MMWCAPSSNTVTMLSAVAAGLTFRFVLFSGWGVKACNGDTCSLGKEEKMTWFVAGMMLKGEQPIK